MRETGGGDLTVARRVPARRGTAGLGGTTVAHLTVLGGTSAVTPTTMDDMGADLGPGRPAAARRATVGSAVVERLNLAQRIVAVAALAAILWLVGSYLTSPVPFSGWIAYAPLTEGPLSRLVVARDGLAPVANLFVWFGLVLGWAAGSFVLLGGLRARRRSAGLPGAFEGRANEAEHPTA